MRSNGSRAAFAATVVANLLPLVGVFGLGWDPKTLTVRPVGEEDDHELRHLREHERATGVFERPASATAPGHLDRGTVGVAAGLAGCVVAGVLWVLVRAPSVAAFLIAGAAPLSVVVFRSVWRRAVPQSSTGVD